MLFWTLRNLRSGDPARRQTAIEELGRSCKGATKPDVSKAVRRALEDDDDGVRSAAGRTRDAYVEFLIVHMKRHAGAVEWHILERKEAARALGELGGARAADALIDALKDRHMLVRATAAACLGELGDPSACSALTNALEDRQVKDAAEKALCKIRRC